MLAVLIKRHYREYALHDLHEVTVDGRAVATADYHLDGQRSHLVTTAATIDELADGSELSRLLADLVADRPADHQAVVDLYVHWGDLPRDQEEASASLAARLAGMPFASQVRRVAVGVVPDDEREVGYFTFRPQPDGSMEEDRPVRDVHPMVGRRLNLWRLRDFELTRLEAPEDVLLCTPSPPATPRTSGSSRWPRCASSSSCATRPARSPRCRTSSGRWPTASRRSAGRGPRSAPAPGSTSTTSGCTSGPPSTPTSTS